MTLTGPHPDASPSRTCSTCETLRQDDARQRRLLERRIAIAEAELHLHRVRLALVAQLERERDTLTEATGRAA